MGWPEYFPAPFEALAHMQNAKPSNGCSLDCLSNNRQGETGAIFQGNRTVVHKACRRVRFKGSTPRLKPVLYMRTKTERSQCTSYTFYYRCCTVSNREGLQIGGFSILHVRHGNPQRNQDIGRG